MRIFNIPAIICDEAEVTVRITLNSLQNCGCLEYMSGKRDGEMTVFGSSEIILEGESGLV